MAEIGLVARIFSVAAVGTSVATTLYETADVMINADQQILSLAKHVSQFTAVLKHMGQVLEAERTNCSKEVLRDIRKIKHSCKRTFGEINSTVKSKRFRRFIAVRWLFKRTKAMELEARLDSQQSMLQCIIHTLTVSKLGRIDSRSKQDSEHITGLTVEIKLLKTFIMESYNNLTELRRAEQSMEAEARYQPMSGGSNQPGTRHPSGDGNTLPPDTTGGSNAYEAPTTRSPSPTSRASKLENEDSNSDDGADDDNNSTKSNDQNDQDGTRPAGDTSNTEGLMSKSSYQPRPSCNDASDPIMHRESNLLLQMVPYRPRLPNGIRSDRLLPGGQGGDSDTKSTTQGATDSVRLLLDKWTTLGSAPVSNILDEEAVREKDEVERAVKRRNSQPQIGTHRRSTSPGAESDEDEFGPTDYPGSYEYSPHFEDDNVPPAPPWTPYIVSGPRRKNFWKPSHHYSQRPERQLGDEILAALRSTRGGIYYTKSNQFRQTHYVDQYPIYTCKFVPSSMMIDNDWKTLDTELVRGSIRREALDLLGYKYIETETGNFSISGDLELGDIEELVKLSYQALDRYSKERSKKIIKEKGWGEAIDAISTRRRMYRNPHMASEYRPPIPQSWNQHNPPYGGDTGHQPFTQYENGLKDHSAPSQAPLPRPRARQRSPVRHRARPIIISPPIEVDRQELDSTRITRPEVRFTLPRAQPPSSTADTAKEAHPSLAKPDAPPTRTDNELHEARLKLEKLIKRKEEAEKSKHLDIVSDISNYAIPDLEENIERLMKQQRAEQKQRTAPVFRAKKYKESYQTIVETDSEVSDDEGGSGVQEVYDFDASRSKPTWSTSSVY